MKKEIKPKKLVVSSTKIRELSDSDLKQAAGGNTPGGGHIVQQR